jgi:DNA-binding SARP family transcriptional activator
MYRSGLEDSWVVGDAYIRVYFMDAIADTQRLMGDINGAEASAERALAAAQKTGGALELGFCTMTSGLIRRAQEDLKGAVLLLEEAIPYLQEKGAWREIVLAHFHLASIYFSLKKKKMALDMLQICADMVKDLGYDHFLVAEASRNPLLVQYASANKLADGYYSRMLTMIKAPGKPEGSEDGEKTAEEGATRTIYAYGFGNLRVEADGREVTDLEWRSEKSKEMFFFFLANRRPLRKEEIVDAIWPEMPDEKTTSAFHSNMYRLRKALYQEVIAKDSGRYILDPQARFTFDVHDYQDVLKEADTAPKGSPEVLKAMERAVELYKGAFASDFYSEWAQTLRYQLEEQQMSLLGALAAAYNEAGEYKKSADICQRIIEVDEFNEAAWYRLMSNYVQSGQQEAARYCYNRYVQAISEDDLDDDVPEFDELVREISGGKQRM